MNIFHLRKFNATTLEGIEEKESKSHLIFFKKGLELAKCKFIYCSGTHGYMAPEVLAKGVAYDSSADWFSFGCMIFKLLKG